MLPNHMISMDIADQLKHRHYDYQSSYNDENPYESLSGDSSVRFSHVIRTQPDHKQGCPVSMTTTHSYPGLTLADSLRLAASQGQTDRVQDLLASGATFEPDKEGRTAVHYAAHNGYADVVQLLASEGANVNYPDNLGYTALHRAAAQGRLDVIKVLLVANCIIDVQDKVHQNTALHEAAWNGFSRSVDLLIKNKAKVDTVNKAGFSALHLSCQNGHNESTRVLLYGGASTSLKNNYGDAPLHMAARCGHAGVTRILLSAKCNINEQNQTGDTALHIATALNRRKITKLLVDNFIDVTIKNKQKQTATDIARKNGHQEIIEVILSQPKQPKNKNGKDGKDKKGKKFPFFWRKKNKESNTSIKLRGSMSLAPSEISSCRQLDQSGYTQSLDQSCYTQSILSVSYQNKIPPQGRNIEPKNGKHTPSLPKQVCLPQHKAQVDQGHNKVPVCNCGPEIIRLEDEIDAEREHMYDHVDETQRILSEQIRSVAQTLDQVHKEHVHTERAEREEAINRRATKERVELEKHIDIRNNTLKAEIKEYVDARINNLMNQDLHRSPGKIYQSMRRPSRKGASKTNLYRSRSDETLSSVSTSTQETYRVSKTQAQTMQEIRKKRRVGDMAHAPARQPPQRVASVRKPRHSLGGCTNLGSVNDFERQQMLNRLNDANVYPRHQPLLSSSAYPSASTMKGYHFNPDSGSGSNRDSGYSNSLGSVKDHHNVTPESCLTDGSCSSCLSIEEQALPDSKQYLSAISNQMQAWYEHQQRNMEKTDTKMRAKVNPSTLNASLESTNSTQV